MLMPFGKYKDLPLTKIPTQYLEWICKNAFRNRELLDAISTELYIRWERKREHERRKCSRSGRSSAAKRGSKKFEG